jgi:hypothetical protein
MADPNTQIDWWIAQAWQEAQGGADSDALVAWLHENGLTAVSSYTILQAALSCSSEEAKQMVFGHPVWAGAEAETDLSGAEYTSDTLEPEPEPDATFGLDDWADEIEEDEPVYGEPGYEPPPTASPTRPAQQDGDTPPQRSMLLDAYSETEAEEAADDAPELAGGGEPLPESHELPEAEQAEADEMPPFASEAAQPAAEFEPVAEFEPAGEGLLEDENSDEDEPEIDAEQVFEIEDEWDAEEAPAKPAPMGSMLPTTAAPRTEFTDPAAAEPAQDTASPAVEVKDRPAPASPPTPAPAAPPPILRMPPATPAERAATFAAAFGKKPTSQPSESGGATAGTPNGGPPSNDTGPAAQAETAPAQTASVSPQPAPVAAPMPQPLVLEPMPEIAPPPPVAPAEPLFTATSAREQVAAPALFPPTPERPTESEEPEEPMAEESPAQGLEPEPEIEDLNGEPAQENAMAADLDGSPAEPGLGEATADIAAETVANVADSMEAPGMEPDVVEFDHEPDDLEEDDSDGSPTPEEDDLPAVDWEEELPDFEIEEPEESAGPVNSYDDGDAGIGDEGGGDDLILEEDQERPRKPLLLDPSDEEPQPSDAEGEPEDLTEAAKKLGINFRGTDNDDIGVDPETAKAAKELGISFRDEDGGPATPDDDAALEAQKLGISFREESVTGKPAKPAIVKYLPMILGLIVIFFVLLIGATFSGTIIEWLKN